MINKARLEALIAAIQKYDAINMTNWRTGSWQRGGKSLEDLHLCGNKACIGGHLAVLPEFRECGGGAVLDCGSPRLPVEEDFVLYGADAVYRFLFDTKPFDHVTRDYIDMIILGADVHNWGKWNAKEAVKALRLLEEHQTGDITTGAFRYDLEQLMESANDQ